MCKDLEIWEFCSLKGDVHHDWSLCQGQLSQNLKGQRLIVVPQYSFSLFIMNSQLLIPIFNQISSTWIKNFTPRSPSITWKRGVTPLLSITLHSVSLSGPALVWVTQEGRVQPLSSSAPRVGWMVFWPCWKSCLFHGDLPLRRWTQAKRTIGHNPTQA